MTLKMLIGAIFVPFDKEFQQVSGNIAHHSTEIDWAANTANIEEAKRVIGSEEAKRQGMLSSLCHFQLLSLVRSYSRYRSTMAGSSKCSRWLISTWKRLYERFLRLGFWVIRATSFSGFKKPPHFENWRGSWEWEIDISCNDHTPSNAKYHRPCPLLLL